MNHDDIPDLEMLDQRAADAARGLRRHVAGHLDRAGQPALEPTAGRQPTPWRRIASVAAVATLVVAGLSTIDGGGDDARRRVDMDQALPDLEPGLLTPLKPDDGKDSIRLPITVEPSTGLTDGASVTVSGDGFLPGESVGIVQCAREAGGDSPETRGGADGCNIGRFESVTADENGRAAGTFVVTRVLTTPLTGTVDCAAEAERCLVAMGALNDYDRSGGLAVEFAGGGEPIEIPAATVSPAEGLADGDTVRVSMTGLTPNDVLYVEVCSSDPLACWPTGEQFEVEHPEENGASWSEMVVGLQADWAGRAEADLQVWRFLPGSEPGTYVDCAVSRCSLRVTGNTAPPTVRLHFSSVGEPPAAPTIAVDPTNGLAFGDEVLVRGANFTPGVEVYPMLCGGGGASLSEGGCFGGDATATVDANGEFSTLFTLEPIGGVCTNETCDATVDLSCDGVTSQCWIAVDSYHSSLSGPPRFQPARVPVTFR